MTPEYKDCFRTTDLYFAAFLKVAEIPFVDCVPDGGQGRKAFLFENTPEIKELKGLWFRSEKANISPLRFAREIQTLKAMTHL